MKKLLYILSFAGLISFGSCSDELNTEPTNSVSGSTIFENVTNAQTAINGVYRMLYVAGWSSNWGTENCGQTGIQLLADLMAEDHLMYSQGQGWFYEDYRLNVHGDYSNTAGRPYSVWNFYYTIISNVNYIIAADYHGHETAPGVPIYTEPTEAGSQGHPRGTVQDVYDQINSDLDRAIELLEGKSQSHISHVDYYVANGFKARVALVQHEYATAAAAAATALSKSELSLATVEALGGNNDTGVADVMWGCEITTDQTSGFAGFFSHMDADATGMYGATAQKCISSGLYNLISDTDERKSAWFRAPLAEDGTGSMVSYCQLKFKMADYTTWTGDYLLMRAEEMVLIKAEAECAQGLYADARATISQLGNLRDTNFATRLAARTDANTYNSDTNAPLRTLMDEILFQRRVELWGEAGRIFDLQRLGLGYNRTYEGSNHTETVSNKNTDAASPLFIFPLPQSEFDGNESLTSADQNPIVM